MSLNLAPNPAPDRVRLGQGGIPKRNARALRVKAAVFAELGLEVNLCGVKEVM